MRTVSHLSSTYKILSHLSSILEEVSATSGHLDRKELHVDKGRKQSQSLWSEKRGLSLGSVCPGHLDEYLQILFGSSEWDTNYSRRNEKETRSSVFKSIAVTADEDSSPGSRFVQTHVCDVLRKMSDRVVTILRSSFWRLGS